MRSYILALLLQLGAGTLYAQTETTTTPTKDTTIGCDTMLLDEITVVDDKSDIATRTANGQIFYLSKEAHKQRNPFKALQEYEL